jgi:glycosyltransferase involved in cell wall biosynthesis
MRILFSSYAFRPSVGGIETVSEILAGQFAAIGHEVRLITETPGENRPEGAYRVIRRPSFPELFALLRWSDVFFQNNISLRSLLPALLMRKRSFVVHQTWIRDKSGRIRWRDRIKYALLGGVTNVAISHAVAEGLGAPASIVGNPYDEKIFRVLPNVARDKTLVFLGRLVSDKGVDVLLEAMRLLRDDGLTPDLTIVGSGPEEEKLRRLAAESRLDSQLTFAGEKSGTALVELLNRHRILVAPSRWAEPFGIVALEGIACGCAVVGSRDGGLKEAIGPCGVTFENGSAPGLALALRKLLNEPEIEAYFHREAKGHLAGFTSEQVAAAYLELLERAEA